MQLRNKVVMVVGAGTGLGRRLACRFAEEGADLVVAARTAVTLEETAEEVRSQGRRALAVPTDISMPRANTVVPCEGERPGREGVRGAGFEVRPGPCA